MKGEGEATRLHIVMGSLQLGLFDSDSVISRYFLVYNFCYAFHRTRNGPLHAWPLSQFLRGTFVTSSSFCGIKLNYMIINIVVPLVYLIFKQTNSFHFVSLEFCGDSSWSFSSLGPCHINLGRKSERVKLPSLF